MIFVHKFWIITTILLVTYAEDKTSNKPVVIKQIKSLNVSTSVIAEGGSLNTSLPNDISNVSPKPDVGPHYGREHVTDGTKPTAKPTEAAPKVKSTTETIIPISETISSEYLSEKADHKKTVPKKGVQLPEDLFSIESTPSSTTKLTTPKPVKPKKPLVTVGNDEEPFAPSHFVSSKSKNVSSIPKVPSIDSYTSKSSGGTDYIVPIVGVILSVPLVAIILNAIYKRTKEWWHHRHYSRMDFLIDGIYNN